MAKTPIELARWRRLQSNEARASRCASASTSRYRLAKNIGFFAVVEAELKLREVERQIFFAHALVAAHDATLEERPEALDAVRVDDPSNNIRRCCGVPLHAAIQTLFRRV